MARLPRPLAKAPVGRRRISRAELIDHQRGRIVEAATGVFAKRGYQPTTVENIVAASGIGVGSFYAHFDGKEECLLAAYEEIVAEALGRIGAATAARAPWPRRALAALHELLALIAAEPLKARVALVEVQTAGPVALARYTETVGLAIATLGGGRALAAVSPPPPASQEAAIANGLAWLLSQRLQQGEAKGAPGLFAEMAEVLLGPYLGAAEARRAISDFARGLPEG